MLSLRKDERERLPQRAPSRFKYRYRRFLMSQTWRTATRVVLPLCVVVMILFYLFTSSAIRTTVTETRENVVNWFAFLPGLKIEELTIENATLLQEGEVLEALDIKMPTSTVLIDRNELREKMSRFDEVGEASFRFGFNGHLYIELRPRVPEMIYFDGADMITIDRMGHKVESLARRVDRAELFVISGAGALDAADEALYIIRALQPYSSQIRGLNRVGARRWDIVLVSGARLMLPADKPLEALYHILKEHQQSDVLNRDIKAYDLRNPERPVLRLPSDAIAPLGVKNDTEVSAQ